MLLLFDFAFCYIISSCPNHVENNLKVANFDTRAVVSLAVTKWYISVPLISGRGTGTDTCGIGSAFPPDDPLIGLDTHTNCTLIYDLLLKIWLIGVCHLFYLYWLMGKGMAYGNWLSCTGCCQYLLNIWATVYTIVHLPRMFAPTDFLFEERNGLPPLYHIYILHSG